MRKFTFVLIMMLGFVSLGIAQTIENFESIKMNAMAFGTTGMMTVVPNPDLVGNPSFNCVKFLRPGKTNGGEAYSGFWSPVPVAVDVTVNKYVHVKVWKSRISPIKFKLEGGAAGNLEIPSKNPQTKVNEWEDIVFDFSEKTGTYPIVSLMPDFEDPLVQASDLTIYFDDIYVNNDPAAGSVAVQIIENYEHIPLNYMLRETVPVTDNSTMTILPNPDKSGLNISDYVIKFLRDKDGLPWGGFWSKVSDYSSAVDVTTNKYVHVKVWKPRISEVKFKLEGGTAGNLEIASMYPQTKINAWEDIVFDFSSKTGTYPIISLMPDVIDPFGLPDDIVIYFDDILVNNNPNPSVSLTLNVDMTGAGLVTGDKVYVAGGFPDWVKPGDPGTIEMTDANNDKIYTVSLVVPAGTKEFKFFKNAGWGGGEWEGNPNRSLPVTSDAIANYIWGSNGQVSVRDNKLAGKIQMYPNPVRGELTINSTTALSKIIITNTLGKVVDNSTYTDNKTINTSNLSSGIYFVTFIGKDGSKVTQKLIKN